MQKLMIKKKLKVYREGLPFSKFLNKLCTSGTSQVVLMVKNLAANAGDIRNTDSIPGLERFPGEWHGNPLQYSCLENLMDRGVWWDTVHRVENSGTPLKQLSMHACMLVSLWPHGLYSPWNSPGQSTEVGSLSLLQGIFPTQGLNWGLPHCRQILYQLSCWGSPTLITL